MRLISSLYQHAPGRDFYTYSRTKKEIKRRKLQKTRFDGKPRLVKIEPWDWKKVGDGRTRMDGSL